MQQAMLQVQQAMLHMQQAKPQVQQAIVREINNKANLSPAELERGLSLAKIRLILSLEINMNISHNIIIPLIYIIMKALSDIVT